MNMIDRILNNPVRLYTIAAAALALVVHYVPSLPTALIIGLVAAVLGVGGEVVRGKVAPMSKVNVHDDDLAPGEFAVITDVDEYRAYLTDSFYNQKRSLEDATLGEIEDIEETVGRPIPKDV